MPEGDTVFRAAARLRAALAGRILTVSDFRVPRRALVDLTGRRVLEVVPRGKHLLVRVDGGLSVHTHLGMDGAWDVRPAADRRRAGPWHQVRLVLANDAFVVTGLRLPVVDVLRTSAEDTVVGHLGPDPLGPDWDAGEAARRIAADPARPIGEALLDQRNLAGVGNVYRSEICFARGISPFTPVGRVADVAAVADVAHRMLTANRDRAARVTTGDDRPGRRTWVYGRAGRPCARCRTLVRRAETGDPPRVVFWCPRCQPASPDGVEAPPGA